jgi:hypothetical protein
MHSLVFDLQTETDAVFRCVHCGAVIGFNKQGIGEPCAMQIDGQWQHPQNPDQWMTPCATDEQ